MGADAVLIIVFSIGQNLCTDTNGNNLPSIKYDRLDICTSEYSGSVDIITRPSTASMMKTALTSSSRSTYASSSFLSFEYASIDLLSNSASVYSIIEGLFAWIEASSTSSS